MYHAKADLIRRRWLRFVPLNACIFGEVQAAAFPGWLCIIRHRVGRSAKPRGGRVLSVGEEKVVDGMCKSRKRRDGDNQRGSAARLCLQLRASLKLAGRGHALNWRNTDRRVCGCAAVARKGEYCALRNKEEPSLKSVRGFPRHMSGVCNHERCEELRTGL